MASETLEYGEIRGLSILNDRVDMNLSHRIREDLLIENRHHAGEILIDKNRRLAPRLISSFADFPVALDGMKTSQLWTPELAELRRTVGRMVDMPFNYALANLYRDRHDFTGWHCDKAQLHKPGSLIAIVSFGATRTLAVRPLGTIYETRFPLTDSSVALMDLDLQATHEHCILAEPEDVDMRLSITLRCIEMLPAYFDRIR